MSTSVKFNNNDLNNVTNIVENTDHDSATTRVINSFKIARRDGEKLVSAFWGRKEITINGFIQGSSQSDFESKVDTLKSYLSLQDKNLDIDYNGATRRYTATAIEVKVARDSYNIDWSPYSVKFLVPSGFGNDTSETTALNKSGIVAATDSETITFAGSAQPKPKNKITLNTQGNADVIGIANTTNAVISGSFVIGVLYTIVSIGSTDFTLIGSANNNVGTIFTATGVGTGTGTAVANYINVDIPNSINYFEINELTQTVLDQNGNSLNYRGKFPSIFTGSNNLEMFIYGSGSTLGQRQTNITGAGAQFYYTTYYPWQAQSFVPTQSGRIQKLNLHIGKADAGSLNGDFVVKVYNDNYGVPGTVIGSGGTFTVAKASVPTPENWTDISWTGSNANRPFVVAGQKYWIVVDSSNLVFSDINNAYSWSYYNLPSGYTLGKAMYQLGYGNGWNDGIAIPTAYPGQFDMAFKIYMGSDGGAPTNSITWQIYYTKTYL